MDRVDRLEPRFATDLCAATRVLAAAGIPYAVIGANALILQALFFLSGLATRLSNEDG